MEDKKSFKAVAHRRVINYAGLEFQVPTNRIISYVATDLLGSVFGYTIEPVYDECTGTWDYEFDDPKDFRIYEFLGNINYEGDCGDSLLCVM